MIYTAQEVWEHRQKNQTEAPAIVVHFDGDFFNLIDGRHRVRSYFIKGLTEIKAFVGDVDEKSF